jgi:hypothetical protein
LLYNVTAIGGRIGIDAYANEASVVRIKAFNSIVRGGESDIEAISQAPGESQVEIELSHSNFATVEATGGAEVSEPTENANQEAAPLFVDEAGGDYREAVGSPTRLAGDLAVVLPGEVDLAGNSRTTNCAGTVGVDIGAYQYECPTPESGSGEELNPVNPITTPIGTPPDNQLPCACVGEGRPHIDLSKLTLKPAKFVVEGKAPKGVALGTTISYTLSAKATVSLEIRGKPTVKGKKQKTVILGTLIEQGKAGANHFKFSGKLKGKPLQPGSFTLRATATAFGQQSDPETAHFTVLAPAIP